VHSTVDGAGGGQNSRGTHLDPAAHAFLLEVALSVPSCPAETQRQQFSALADLAATQQPVRRPNTLANHTQMPDVAGEVRELRFALRAADHYSSTVQQL
jgi:hypothetical protein